MNSICIVSLELVFQPPSSTDPKIIRLRQGFGSLLAGLSEQIMEIIPEYVWYIHI